MAKLNAKKTIQSYAFFREFEFSLQTVNTIWRFIIPPLWVIAIFLVSLPLWIALSVRALGNFFFTLKFIPVLFLGMGLLTLPFQESQVIFIQVVETVLECVDSIYNGIQLPSLNDFFHCLYPLCQIWERFWDYAFMLIRIVCCQIRSFIVNDLLAEIDGFCQTELGFSAPEALEIAQDVIDFLAVGEGVCTGPFYGGWTSLSPEDYVGDTDLFWPPDKRDLPSLQTLMYMNRQFVHNNSVYQARMDFERTAMELVGEELSSNNRNVQRFSTWADEDSIWKKTTFHSFKRWKKKQTRECCSSELSIIYDLFSDGPNGFNTVIFGFICGDIDGLIENFLYIILFCIDWIGRVFSATYEDLITQVENILADGNPSFFFWQFFDELYALLLDIPCIDFENEEAFFVSIFDCTCEQVIGGIPIFDDLPNFQYVPASSWEDLATTLPCCIGFCCVMDGWDQDPLSSNPSLPSSFTGFFENFFTQCLQATVDIFPDDTPIDIDPTLPFGRWNVPEPNSVKEKRSVAEGGTGYAPDFNSFDTLEEETSVGGSGYIPSEAEQWAATHMDRTTRQSAYLKKEAKRLMYGRKVNIEVKTEKHQKAIDETERVLKEKTYPEWLKNVARNVVKGHPEISGWFIARYGKSYPYDSPTYSRDPDNEPYEYLKSSFIGAPMRKMASRAYNMLTNPPGIVRQFGNIITIYGSRLFDIMDAKLAKYGNTRSIRLENIIAFQQKNQDFPHKRKFMDMHWLRRYANMHEIETERYVRTSSQNPVEGQNETHIELTDGQLAMRASYILMIDTMDIVSSVNWNAQSFDFDMPSYDDIAVFLMKDVRADVTIYDMGRLWSGFFRDYVEERIPRWNRPPVIVETEVMLKTITRRILVPERIKDLEEQFNSYGGAYEEAAFRHVRPVREALDKEVRNFHNNMETLYTEKNLTQSTAKDFIPNLAAFDFSSFTDDSPVSPKAFPRSWESEASADEAEHGTSLSDTSLIAADRNELIPPVNYTVTTKERNGNIPKVELDAVKARLRVALTTSSYRQFHLWRQAKARKQETSLLERKTSYDFQRRLANYMGEDLARLDPKLKLPEDPYANITAEIAAQYYMTNNMIRFKENESWSTRKLSEWFSSLFHTVDPDERAIDPEIQRIFKDIENRERGYASPEEGEKMFLKSTRLGGVAHLVGLRTQTRIDTSTNIQLGIRDLSRLPQLAALAPVFSALLPLIKQWRWLVAAIVPIFSAPQFRVAGRIALNPYLEFFADIYKEGLKPTFSPANLEELGVNVGFSILEIILYVVTVILRFVLCKIIPLTLSALANIFGVLAAIIGGPVGIILQKALSTIGPIVTVLTYCPPEIELDSDGVPVLEPWNYFFAILDCNPLTPCTDETDCPGRAPCRCQPRTAQYTSVFWSLDGDFDQNCPGNSGTCLCWPRLPCDFELPPINLSEPFEKDCQHDFGYRTDNIVWYQDPSIFDWLVDTLYNTYVSFRFVTRTIVRGYKPFFSETVLLAAGLLLIGIAFALQRYSYMVFFFLLLIALNFGTVLITTTVSDYIIPGLQNIGNKVFVLEPLTTWLLTFIQFDNATESDPIGSPEAGEFVCWLFNSATFWVGIFVFTAIAGILTGLLTSGFLRGIISFLLFFVLWPFRRIYDCIALFLSASTVEGMYENDDPDEDPGLITPYSVDFGNEGQYAYAQDPDSILASVYYPDIEESSTMRRRKVTDSEGPAPKIEVIDDSDEEKPLYGPIPEASTPIALPYSSTDILDSATQMFGNVAQNIRVSRLMDENAWTMPDYKMLWNPARE
jgi:hypothetical protein